MIIQVPKAVSDNLGFDLAQALADFAAAKDAHRLTVGVPAPTAHPLVEHIFYNGGQFAIVDEDQNPSGEMSLVEYAAHARWQKEIGGITISGMPIHTDDRSKSLIQGAYLQANRDPNFTTQWKTDQGFVQLDAAQIEAMALAVGAHVQACFAKEAEVIAKIDDELITDTAGVDAEFEALSTTY